MPEWQDVQQILPSQPGGFFSVFFDIRVVSRCIEDALEIDGNFWMESVGDSLDWHHINHDSSNLGLFSVTGLLKGLEITDGITIN